MYYWKLLIKVEFVWSSQEPIGSEKGDWKSGQLEND